MTCKVAFIGLGVMGYPMAGYISKAGHNVTVYNRTKSKAEKWIKQYKGKIAATPEEAAKDSDFVFTCVGNDDDLKEVAIGKKGIKSKKREGDLTTPKGTFKIKSIFFRKDRIKRLKSKIKLKQIRKDMGWCDDPKSKKYNTLIKYPFNYKSEKFYRSDNIYDIILVLNYNWP